MKKVFIISYSCCPERQSELAIGWNFVKNLSKENNLTVLTRAKNKEQITAFVEKSNDKYLKKIEWLFYDFNKPFLKLKRILGTQLYYFFWQKFSYKLYKKKIIEEGFDIIHHLNFGIVWMYSPFYKLPIKFIWGPLGGGDSMPWSFLLNENLSDAIREIMYKILVFSTRNFSIQNKLCKRYSSEVLYRTKQVAKRHDNSNFKKNNIICETGFDLDKIKYISYNDFSKVRAITIGRMDYWKGIFYAVKGFEKFILNGGKGELTIIGNGKGFIKIKKYLKRKNLNNFIKLKGKLDYSQYLELLGKSNILVYPSFRDGGSFTVLESMAMGKPVLCSCNSGPAEMVTDETGFIIDAISPDQYVNDISNTLFNIQNNPKIVEQKSINSRKRAVNFYTWENHAKKISKIYNKLI